MNKSSNWPVRIAFYVIGFLIMTLGIAVSVKSNLGVSPVSSIPYTMTCVIGLEMGLATVVFHVILVAGQILLLRGSFEKKNLLQIPAGILFGYFTTFCNHLMTYFPTPDNMVIRLCMMLASAFFIAFGIFLYVPADIIPLAGEGMMLAVSKVTKIKFSTVKLCFDISMVCISLVVCLTCIHQLGSVGIGTIIAAVLVGTLLKMITRVLGPTRDRILKKNEDAVAVADEAPVRQIMKTDVYSVSPDMNLQEALRFLVEHDISGAPVVGADGNLCGFISDGDIIHYLSEDYSLFVGADDQSTISINDKLKKLIGKQVRDLMIRRVITVDITDSFEEICLVIKEHKLKKVPVMENGRMIGIINRGSITKYALKLMEIA